jgi:transcriptional regulator with XRE-family HTH domain
VPPPPYDARALDRVAAMRCLLASGRARQLRLDARLGLRELARAARVSPTAVSQYERGRHAPRPDAALRLARVYLPLLEADET